MSNKKNIYLLFVTVLLAYILTGCGGSSYSDSTVMSYSVGGSATGLVGTMVLQNNNSDDLTVTTNGTFNFEQKIASGNTYSVSVLTQPEGQSCTVSNASGTIGDADISDVAIECSFNGYSIGGSVAGLVGSLILQNNLEDNLTITANGSFTFAQTVTFDNPYDVTVQTQPVGQTCVVINGSGTISAAEISNVAVDCSYNSFTLGGTLTGLSAGNSITLKNNDTDELVLVTDGSFAFATLVLYGSDFQVSLSPTTPTAQPCVLTYGEGNVLDNIASVRVTCGLAGGLSTFSDTGTPSLTGRNLHTATLLSNGNVLISAGRDQLGVNMASAELYDSTTGEWTATGPLVESRHAHTATLLANGKVLVTGGQNSNGIIASVELYDPALGEWTSIDPLAVTRDNHTATLLMNGLVLVSAGQHSNGTCELYDPTTSKWRSTGSMAQTRYGHTATLLPNGKVLVSGGWSGFGYLASAELYDPVTGEWSTSGSMSETRSDHTATLLSSGKVLITGGAGDTAFGLASAELYDPVTEQWSNTGTLAEGRTNHSATLLPSGLVLVAGNFTSSAELYDPSSGLWTYTGSMNAWHNWHTATSLVNGKVLIVGGVYPENSGAAELFW